MKRIIKLVVLLCVAFGVYMLLYNKDAVKDTGNKAEEAAPVASAKPEIKQGTITIINTDAATQLPIRDTEYTITRTDSAAVVETVKTDTTGKATSGLLDYGAGYTIKQKQVMLPYELAEEELHVDLNAPTQQVIATNQMFEHVKETERTEDGYIQIKKVYMNVDVLMQKPELPNGCEITSLTAVLNYYGYEASKTEMSDVYLPKEPFSSKEGKVYGPDPYKAYAGDPRELKGGFFSFAPPIVEAANNYFNAVGRKSGTSDISGSTREQILEQLDKGIPVVIWITLDLSPPKMNYSWYFNDTGEYYDAPVNLHVVVLNGYEDDRVHVMNPLKGQVTYDADTFFDSYDAMGSHAMIVSN